MKQQFFSIKASAVALNRSPETVRRWCRRRHIGHKPVPGAGWMISEEELKKLRGDRR
ncbi:MAG: helix-turn-helix domain-containing protein [Xanthobacteraceae bacterium]